MNVIDIISNMYKNELAEANHKKIIALAQCNIYEQRIKQLEKQLKEKEEQLAILRSLRKNKR